MSASNLLSQDKSAIDRKAYEPSMEEILASIRRIIADDQAFTAQPAQSDTPAEPVAERSAERTVAIVATMAPQIAETAPAEAAPTAPHAPELRPVASVPRDEALATREEAAAKDETSAKQPEPPATAAAVDTAAPQAVVQIAAPPRIVHSDESETQVQENVRQQSAETANASEPDDMPAVEESGVVESVAAQAEEAPLVSAATDQAVSTAFNTLMATRLLQNDDKLVEIAREMIRPMLKAWLDDNLPIMVERLVRAEIERVARGGR